MDVLMTKNSALSQIRGFLKDTRGNYALMTVIAAVPLFGAVALAVDYSQMSRERQMTLNALDAAGIATARRILEGESEAKTIVYAQQFFDANLGKIDPARAKLTVYLPGSKEGGGTLKMSAVLSYDPIFFGTFQSLLGKDHSALSFAAATEIKLKNTIEVALVLDNSGSMDEAGKGSGRKRMDVLKDAAKQLVETMAAQSGQMRQVDKPVQIGLVPFAASVNVGTDAKGRSWMDMEGASPIHHENFDWTSFGTRSNSPNKYVEDVGGIKRARGREWGELQDAALTRFTLYDNLKRMTGTRQETRTINRRVCVEWNRWAQCTRHENRAFTERYSVNVFDSAAIWGGCVESRPYPYNLNDEPASKGNPSTLFVPMFAPDETDEEDTASRPSNNNWWHDATTSNSLYRQQYMPKYFSESTENRSAFGLAKGPNASCSTKAITPLVDVSTSAGVTTINNAIDAMIPLGATNVPEGMAWGWRVLSSHEPFIGGRPETERGNDKVLIVLTDGANTYYTPESTRIVDNFNTRYTGGGNDLAGNKAIYSAYGYTKYNNADGRIFRGTSVRKSDFSNGNYTAAMNQHFAELCETAKENRLVVMTVALDLDEGKASDQAQISALTACASDSRVRKGSDGKAAKLFWNSTGATLADDFKSIADELSNLRIVS